MTVPRDKGVRAISPPSSGHRGGPFIPVGVNEYWYVKNVKKEPETPSQRARIQNPELAFTTALPSYEAMARMLEIMGRAAFNTVMSFKGPVVDPTPEVKEGLHVREAVAQLRALEDPKVPVGGLVAKVRYWREAGIVATVKVGRALPAKVSVRVRGAPMKSDWHAVRMLVRDRMEDIDQGE
jgi:hypothetical protein